MDKALERGVRQRAGYRCEFCHLPEAPFDLKHEIDHVVPKKNRGPTDPSNLALCCARCNLYKGTDLSGIDPDTGRIERLFNPRQDAWDVHFQWNGPILIGLTAIGRTTIAVLKINQPQRIQIRSLLTG